MGKEGNSLKRKKDTGRLEKIGIRKERIMREGKEVWRQRGDDLEVNRRRSIKRKEGERKVRRKCEIKCRTYFERVK